MSIKKFIYSSRILFGYFDYTNAINPFQFLKQSVN
nr:MAG TPA: hypothetical protein [Caudoviricetes sp.]